MIFAPPNTAPDTDAAKETETDGMRVLQTLAQRWKAAQTLEYQSLVVMQHAGEFRVQIKVLAQMRRPRFARFVWDADQPDVSRVRVCDGRVIYDRSRGSFLRPPQTRREGLENGTKVTQNVPHPLDEASYCADQFFSPAPFVPPPTWGEGDGKIHVTAAKKTDPKTNKPSGFRITMESGTSRDTLLLDADYAPRQIVRVAEHGGRIQEILNEKFTVVRLGAYLPAELFRWNARRDEAANATFLPPSKENKQGDAP